MWAWFCYFFVLGIDSGGALLVWGDGDVTFLLLEVWFVATAFPRTEATACAAATLSLISGDSFFSSAKRRSIRRRACFLFERNQCRASWPSFRCFSTVYPVVSRRICPTFSRFFLSCYGACVFGRRTSRALDMDSSAAQVETEHVHRVYDDIAFHFSHTRYKPWPKIAEFLAALPSGSFVADIGT